MCDLIHVILHKGAIRPGLKSRKARPNSASALAQLFLGHKPNHNPVLIPGPRPAKRQPKNRGSAVQPPKTNSAKTLTEGQRAYEAKRAAKAGMSLDKWLTSKQREKEAEAKAAQKAVEAAKPPKPPGFFGRLLDRAHRPLGS